MIVLLSPAKAMDLGAAAPAVPPSSPVFGGGEHAELLAALRAMTQPQLKSLLGVSDDLARLNHQRYKSWDDASTVQKPCALAFNGPAYQQLRAWDFNADEAAHAQDCVRILSGLYGLLRPMDVIKPYRLDMGRKLKNSKGANLYAFWRDRVTARLNEELSGPQHEGSRFVVNCASAEYFKCVNAKGLEYPVYHCVFPGVASVHAKQARGAMARHAVVSSARSVQQLQRFTGGDGEFVFDGGARGGPEQLVFLRRGAKEKGKLPAKRKREADEVAPAKGTEKAAAAEEEEAKPEAAAAEEKVAAAKEKTAPAREKTAAATGAKATPARRKAAPADAKATPTDAKVTAANARTTPASARTTPKATSAKAKATPARKKAGEASAKATPKATPRATPKATPAKTKATPLSKKATPANAKATPAASKATPTTKKAKATPATGKAKATPAKATPAKTQATLGAGKAKVTPTNANATPADSKATPARSAKRQKHA